MQSEELYDAIMCELLCFHLAYTGGNLWVCAGRELSWQIESTQGNAAFY